MYAADRWVPAVDARGSGGREFEPGAVPDLWCVDEPAVLRQHRTVDREAGSEWCPDRPQQIRDPVVDRVRMHGDPPTIGVDDVETRRRRLGDGEGRAPPTAPPTECAGERSTVHAMQWAAGRHERKVDVKTVAGAAGRVPSQAGDLGL